MFFILTSTEFGWRFGLSLVNLIKFEDQSDFWSVNHPFWYVLLCSFPFVPPYLRNCTHFGLWYLLWSNTMSLCEREQYLHPSSYCYSNVFTTRVASFNLKVYLPTELFPSYSFIGYGLWPCYSYSSIVSSTKAFWIFRYMIYSNIGTLLSLYLYVPYD